MHAQVERRSTKNVVDLLEELATTNKASHETNKAMVETNKAMLETNKAVVAEIKGVKDILSKQVEAEKQKSGGKSARALCSWAVACTQKPPPRRMHAWAHVF